MLKESLPTVRFFATKSTIEPKQFAPFNELSKVWWDADVLLKQLHELNKIRIPMIENGLMKTGIISKKSNKNSPLEGVSILDVGCGGGVLSEPLSRLGAKVTGLDCNSAMLAVAISHAKDQNFPNLKYLLSTIEEHVVDNKEKYDVIVASEVVEHVSNLDVFIKHCVECLKPGGSFFVTTNAKSQISKFLFITLQEDILRKIPKGTHEYEKFVDVKDLKNMLQRENCETIYTSGAIYNLLLHKWQFIKSHYIGHYLLHAVKK